MNITDAKFMQPPALASACTFPAPCGIDWTMPLLSQDRTYILNISNMHRRSDGSKSPTAPMTCATAINVLDKASRMPCQVPPWGE